MTMLSRITRLAGMLLVLLPLYGKAQEEYAWWNAKHHWDGVTHWSKYIITSPGYMGPNALPVPETHQGLLPDNPELELVFESHFSKGDNTRDAGTRLFLPVVKNLVGMELSMVPLEQYNMDTATRDERRTRNRTGEGWAVGDLAIGTVIQLVKGRKSPDVILAVNLKTASGTKLSDARYTDAPAYSFSLDVGKDLARLSGTTRLRGYGMLGFYAWQTNLDNNRQDDALLFGAGLGLRGARWQAGASLAGYAGYFGAEKVVVADKDAPLPYRDRPLVCRINLRKDLGRVKALLAFQRGLHDFGYTTLRAGLIFVLQKKQKPKPPESAATFPHRPEMTIPVLDILPE